ncbi:carboxyl transferase domain-containing protein, partial [Planctomycetota bacterium]
MLTGPEQRKGKTRGPLVRPPPITLSVALEAVATAADCPVRPARSKPLRAHWMRNVSRLLAQDGICFTLMSAAKRRAVDYVTFSIGDGRQSEVAEYRGLHRMWAQRLELRRFQRFSLERQPAPEDIYLFRAVAKENPRDERLFALVDVRDVTEVQSPNDGSLRLPFLEGMLLEALSCMEDTQYRRPKRKRLLWNQVLLHVWPPLRTSIDQVCEIVRRLSPATANLGLDKIVVRVRQSPGVTGELIDRELHFHFSSDHITRIHTIEPNPTAIEPISPYTQKVVRLRSRGLVYPYEIIRMLTPATADGNGPLPRGEFVEYDLGGGGNLEPVERSYGLNTANVVVGVLRNFSRRHPQGVVRVVILGDPSKEMGALAEPECRRVVQALSLAAKMRVPVEWYAVSAGAKISMESGTENLDWTARVLRRIVEFTRHGGEINVVVCGVSVGAQSYWNAEATMLMHTRGVLVMVPGSAMVLTGKRALDFSGGVSAEDNSGIGGADRIMGPNGQAQYIARDLTEACKLLMRHYDHTYIAPGERFPRATPTDDARDRDITTHPYEGDEPFGLRASLALTTARRMVRT